MSQDQKYYRRGFDELVAETHSWRNVANAVPYIIPYLKNTDKLLDVGLGPGTILKDFANYVSEVVGIEPTQELVDVASNQENLPKQVLFQLALVLDLPFKDNSFDIVHALQVVIHLENPVTALREMLRVCKPGGYVCVKDADKSMTVVYPEVYSEKIIGYFRNQLNGLDTLMVAGRQLKERAIRTGYNHKNIHMNALTWFISTESERKKWADMFSARIRAGKEVDYDGNKEGFEEVVKAFDDWKNDKGGIMIFVHGEMVYRKD